LFHSALIPPSCSSLWRAGYNDPSLTCSTSPESARSRRLMAHPWSGSSASSFSSSRSRVPCTRSLGLLISVSKGSIPRRPLGKQGDEYPAQMVSCGLARWLAYNPRVPNQNGATEMRYLTTAIAMTAASLLAITLHLDAQAPQQDTLVWAPVPKTPSKWIAPNKPHTKLADLLAAHKAQSSWRAPTVRDTLLAADYVQMAPGDR